MRQCHYPVLRLRACGAAGVVGCSVRFRADTSAPASYLGRVGSHSRPERSAVYLVCPLPQAVVAAAERTSRHAESTAVHAEVLIQMELQACCRPDPRRSLGMGGKRAAQAARAHRARVAVIAARACLHDPAYKFRMTTLRVSGGAVVLSVDGVLLLLLRRPGWRAHADARAAWAVARSSSPRRRRGEPVRAPLARHACRDAPAQLTTVTLRRGAVRFVLMVPVPPWSGGAAWRAERCVFTPCVDGSAAAGAPGSRCPAGREGGTAGSRAAARWMVPAVSCRRCSVGEFESMGLSSRLIPACCCWQRAPHVGVTLRCVAVGCSARACLTTLAHSH